VKAIINGKRYDTEKAMYMCDCSPRGFYRGDHQWEDTGLYVTPKGTWFLAGEGGPRSRWARSLGQNSYSEGSGIQPLHADDARELLERHGEACDVEEHFGSKLEDA
jgi:hypothetical protein